MRNHLKRQCLFFLCTFFLVSAFAQTEKQVFGTISKEDLASKASTIDKNAEAEVLYENYELVLEIFSGRLQISIKAHTRIKIYNENGLDEANIKIPYQTRNGAEAIYKLEAQTYNLDASGNMTISKMDKKSVYDKRITNRISHQIFSLPEVKAGSIIEYTYVIKRHSLYIDDWSFQRSIPVRYSNYNLEYPAEFSFSHIVRATLPVEIKDNKGTYSISKSYTMRNVPALKDEPFISCDDDYLQQVQFKLNGYFSPTQTINFSKTWLEVVKDMMSDADFGQQLSKKIQNTDELTALLAPLKSSTAKMTAIHNYVRTKMTWDENSSIWTSDGVKQAWSDKKGNSSEMNLIMINLLKNAGLNANPLLVSTRNNGKINTLYPNLDQFNTVMTLVTIDSNYFILDAVDKITPSHLIPEGVMFTEGLTINQVNTIMTEKDFSWVNIWSGKQKYYRVINMSAEMNDEGKIQGEAFIINSEYARLASLRTMKEDKAQGNEELTRKHIGLKLSEFSIKNQEKDSLDLEQKFKFEIPANETGDYRYFSINMFSGMEKNPFIADERSSDITYGVNQKYSLRGIFTIPAGYSFEELPKDIRMVMPDKSITMTRYMQATGNKISYSVVVEFNQPVYAVEDYPEFKEFYKKMVEMLEEQIVIKKTKP